MLVGRGNNTPHSDQTTNRETERPISNASRLLLQVAFHVGSRGEVEQMVKISRRTIIYNITLVKSDPQKKERKGRRNCNHGGGGVDVA